MYAFEIKGEETVYQCTIDLAKDVQITVDYDYGFVLVGSLHVQLENLIPKHNDDYQTIENHPYNYKHPNHDIFSTGVNNFLQQLLKCEDSDLASYSEWGRQSINFVDMDLSHECCLLFLKEMKQK
jgi:hypothetical protein